MDAGVQALAAHLDETWDALLKEVAGADDALFQWTPGPDFNSVAILLRHLAGSERYWIGGAVGGIPSHRVREREFVHDRPAREAVLRAVEEARRTTRRVLAPLAMGDLQVEMAAPAPATGPGRRTKLWALLHYLEHLGYHRGQALLVLKLGRRAAPEAAAR
jgi:uncharacterized damage-inducible protein DinB